MAQFLGQNLLLLVIGDLRVHVHVLLLAHLLGDARGRVDDVADGHAVTNALDLFQPPNFASKNISW